jgi:hypothetical protein
MREYAKVAPQFWTGETGRAMRGDTELQVLAMYLMTAPGANMAGVYYLPLPTLAHETGVPPKALMKALRRASEGGFAHYDERTETVWVPEMARFQVGVSMKPGDNRIAGLVSMLWCVPKSPFIKNFYEKYKDAYHLPEEGPWKGLARGFGGASEALGSHEQEKEQEKEQEPEEDEPDVAIARRVFSAWRLATGHTDAKFDDKRSARIRARLNEGFTEEDLVLALEGWKRDPWCQGRDPNNSKVYDRVETIFRDAGQVEKFISYAKQAPPANQDALFSSRLTQTPADIRAAAIIEQARLDAISAKEEAGRG